MRSPRTPSRRRSPIPSTSTRRKSTRSRRGACSTGWSGTRSRPSSGRRCGAGSRQGGCSRWRCGWWWSARRRSPSSFRSKPEIKNEASAQAIVADALKLPFKVTTVEKGERRRPAPPPFRTSTLQQEAAKQLGYSAAVTMRLAQQLYEGIEIGAEGPVGLITYMRTDSIRVADSAVAQARDFIAREFDKRYLPATPNVHKTGKGQSRVQDAHEAIRPTDVLRRPDDLKQHLDAKQFKLYQLIWRRFVASQMNPAVFETTKVDFDLGRYVFRATGSRVLFDGYHKLYHEAHEPEEGKTLEDLPPIPPLVEGDVVTVKQITPNQHFTEPPPRFSEASLVKELERLGIGRPSTYAAIISTLKNRW
ncbi:MAG: hypothetical protein DMD69_13805 [Gemmatimonadetes bacterium]|nr:MAG: hypothetical protein DMD69_13805 [Gemmatimonadota bacterium]